MADTDRYKRATERRLVDYLGANVRVLVLAAAALDLVSCNADMRPIGRQTEDGGASDSGTMVDSGGGFIPCGLGDLRMPDAAQASERQCGDAPRVLIHLADETPECGPGSGQTAPLIAVNASHVYFPLQWLVPIPNEAGSLQGYLLRVPIEGGHAERIAPVPSGAAHSVRGLALTSTDVLFIRAPIELGGNAAIVSVPLDGGEISTLAEATGRANAVVVDDRNAYFADEQGVKSITLTGGAPRILASSIVARSLGLVGNRLYVTASDRVLSISMDGGEVATVAEIGGRSLISCGDRACWLGGTALRGTLVQLDRAGNPVTLAEGLVEAQDLVFDGNYFFVSGSRGLLSGVPAVGGTPAAAYVEPGMYSLAIQGDCLYWASATTISSVAIDAARASLLQ